MCSLKLREWCFHHKNAGRGCLFKSGTNNNIQKNKEYPVRPNSREPIPLSYATRSPFLYISFIDKLYSLRSTQEIEVEQFHSPLQIDIGCVGGFSMTLEVVISSREKYST